MNPLIKAQVVFDGLDVKIPEEMGKPRDDQMLGTPAERLSELSGRVCYDSLGKGRPSFSSSAAEGYHDHIRQVGHGSVWEHFNFTVEVSGAKSSEDVRVFREMISFLCINRPGVLLLPCECGVRITLNLRSVVEWENFTRELYVMSGVADERYKIVDNILRMSLVQIAKSIAPNIVKLDGKESGVRIVEPINDYERWISMYVTGSRGMSHELVRHGDFTAISQRSTRFVDESETPWVEHPLQTAHAGGVVGDMFDLPCVCESREMYRTVAGRLENWLIDRGVEKTSARKQARGAARGYLGNALHTALIFSANVAQWKRMLRQRASQFADAEIRELFCKALIELKASRYGDRFSNWSLVPSPDGIGDIAVEASEPQDSSK